MELHKNFLKEVSAAMRKFIESKNLRVSENYKTVLEKITKYDKQKDGVDLEFALDWVFLGEDENKSQSIYLCTETVKSFASNGYIENQNACDAEVVLWGDRVPEKYELIDMFKLAKEELNVRKDLEIDEILYVTIDEDHKYNRYNSFTCLFLGSHMDGWEYYILRFFRNEGKWEPDILLTISEIIEVTNSGIYFDDKNNKYLIDESNQLSCKNFHYDGIPDERMDGASPKNYARRPEYIYTGIKKQYFDSIKEHTDKIASRIGIELVDYIKHGVIFNLEDFSIIKHNGNYFVVPKSLHLDSQEYASDFKEDREIKLDVSSDIEDIIPISYKPMKEYCTLPFKLDSYENANINVCNYIFPGYNEMYEKSDYIIKCSDGSMSILTIYQEKMEEHENGHECKKPNTRFRKVTHTSINSSNK